MKIILDPTVFKTCNFLEVPMENPIPIDFSGLDRQTLKQIFSFEDVVVILTTPEGEIWELLKNSDFPQNNDHNRYLQSDSFQKLSEKDFLTIDFPSDYKAKKLVIQKLPPKVDEKTMRQAGSKLGKIALSHNLLIVCDHPKPEYYAEGLALRAYRFEKFKTQKTDEKAPVNSCKILCRKPGLVEKRYEPLLNSVKGTFFTRNLVNEPANSLTTESFADRLSNLEDLGVNVQVLDEEELRKLGMNTLLAVGEGSASPSKVVIMEWHGSDDNPVAIVGKGVCFDTGGISLKPAKGMEQMTMDMAGAGVVSGVMKSVALQKAKAHVVGIVGLVENMPGSAAQRPGDIVRSMKGDTVEVLNTDAEGRLVLADILWHVQNKYNPSWMIDLATLTGAIVVSLGHEYAGLFSNNDKLCSKFLKSADFVDEKAWRQPLDDSYDKQLDSRLADMKNIGGPYAGAITAAQFLQRFVKTDTPWIHLDIAGVAFPAKEGAYAPKGPSGWGVRSILNLIDKSF